jgi:hypothetical protein
MQWNNHNALEGKHAFLGASNYHWTKWSDDIFQDRYYGQFATTMGTAIHALAHDCIVSRMKLNKHDTHLIEMTLWKNYIPRDAYDSNYILANLMAFVNDAIGYHMSSEIILYYNAYCFGTTDAISYDETNHLLRIHDLKTGTIPAHIEQLYIYAALFCLEYHVNPEKTNFELRIYQNMQCLIDNPDGGVIQHYMDLITNRSQLILGYLEREGK